MRSNPSAEYPFPKRPPIPPEHGAWAMLFISLVVAHWVARAVSSASLLASVGLVFMYLARFASSLIAMRWKWWRLQKTQFFRDRIAWTVLYGAIGMMLLWNSFIAIPVPHLIGFALIGLILLGLEWVAVAHQAQKTAVSEVVGTIGVVLVAPFLHTVLSGGVTTGAIVLWGILATHFVLGVLYVRMRIRATREDVKLPDAASRLRFALPTFLYACISFVFLVILFVQQYISFFIVFGYSATLLRLLIGYRRLGQKFVVQRLGWSEVAYSVLFASMVGVSGL